MNQRYPPQPAARDAPRFGEEAGNVDTWEVDTWEVDAQPGDLRDAAWRDRLLAHVRGALEQKLRADPGAHDLTWRTPFGAVTARRRGTAAPGAPLRLAFSPSAPSIGTSPADLRPGDLPASLPTLRLPDEATCRLDERLVGLDDMRRDVLLRWECQWDRGLETWARRSACVVPPALRDHLENGHALLLFAGDPGCGKSALARALANAYCRRQGTAGTILWLTTQARGEGLVGDFSRRIRAAFDWLASLPEGELRLLVVDEADALAMRRSEAQSHQEDRAATAALLQCLDAAAGHRRLAVILTTNLGGNIDAAVRRRAHVVTFGRPGRAARVELLIRWLPHLDPRALDRAARAADGMTPADIDRAMAAAWLGAVGAQTTLTAAAATVALRRGLRTGRV